MYKIGVVGSRASVLCFLAAGFSVYEAESTDEAAVKLRNAADDGCAVIFISPDYAAALTDEMTKYSSKLIPAVIPLPQQGSDYGTEQLKSAVIRAVGADIIFNKK